MKITKYPQSCMIIEQNNKRMIIDPGSFVSENYKVSELLPLDLVLITHEHSDHIDKKLLENILKSKNIPVVANKSTSILLEDMVTNIIEDYEEITLEGFKIIARELPHVLMVDGSTGPQNTGYIIDGIFFHAGDGINIENLKIDTAAIPIAGPDISPKDVKEFIDQIECHTIIPIHYDFFTENPEMLNNNYFFPDVKAIILENGQSTEI